MKKEEKYFTTKKCAICKKEIALTASGDWGYTGKGRNGTIYFCSYSHMREYERAHAIDGKVTRFFRNLETGEEIALIELAELVGVTRGTLDRYCKEDKIFRGKWKFVRKEKENGKAERDH